MKLLKLTLLAIVLFSIVGVISVIDYREYLFNEVRPSEGFILIRENDLFIIIGCLLSLLVVILGVVKIREYEGSYKDKF